jgi:O-antigen/teichoic acid export membrane protein
VSVTASADGGTEPVRRRLRWSGLNSVSTLVASALTLLMVSRYVAPAEYGRVAVILATWGLLIQPIIWAGSLTMRFGPEELRARGVLAETVGTRLVFALPGLSLVVLGPLFLVLVRGWSPLLATMTAAWALASLAWDLMQWSAIAAQRFRLLSVASVLVKAAPLTVIGVHALVSFDISAEHLVGSTLLGTVAAALLLFAGLSPLVRRPRLSRALLARMWHYGRTALAGMPALAAIAWADPLLLDSFSSRAEVGRYQLAYPTTTVFATLGASFNAVLSPELVRANAANQPSVLDRYRRSHQPAGAVVLAMLGFGGACVAQPVVRALLPDSYAETATLVSLLSVGGGFLLAFWTLQPLVVAMDRMGSLLVGNIAQAVVNVLGDVGLGRCFGAQGVALANIIAWATAFVTLTLLLGRDGAASRRALAPVLGAGVLFTAVVWLPSLRPWAPLIGVTSMALAGLGLRRYVLRRGKPA